METILAKALGQDVTQLAAEEKQRLLGRLLARLAHEIRNPLSSIGVHVQLLEEDLAGLDPALREKLSLRLGVIDGELHRLETIVKYFLGLSSPSEVRLEPVLIPKMMQHVCELLRPEAATREIEIAVNLAEPMPPIMADQVRLTQAILNLMINALQAIDRNGRIDLTVATGPECLLIQVADSGPGIPAEKLEAIFEPYFTTKPEGSGLGLWIAQQIASAHGGDLHAANGSSGGAVFTLRLPARTEDVIRG